MERTESELFTYTLPEGHRRERADKALAHACPELSRMAWARVFDAGLVTRNREPLAKNDDVRPGDVISYRLPGIVSSPLRAADIALDILFEDEHLLAINKPAGMVVHPGAGTGEDTLVHALLGHCAGSLSGIGGVERPGIVHRLDRETTGVILAAKSDAAHRGLAAQFAERDLTKHYVALVSGCPRLMSGVIDAAIGRHPVHRHRMTTTESGKPARTDWEIVEGFAPLAALVRCHIHTGRTHQIRVHLRSIGHTLLGDATYGWKMDSRYLAKPPRVMLHAESIGFTHPVTGKELVLKAPLPEDFHDQMKSLRDQVVAKAKGR